MLFARRYLSWDAAEPQVSQRLLAPMVGATMDSAAGLSLPEAGSQSVAWAEVIQGRQPEAGSYVYTVAAQIDGGVIVYLAVDVTREADGDLALSGYPAFIGPPADTGAQLASAGPAMSDRGLGEVVTRALRNYLSGSTEDLNADLSPEARVAVPSVALTLDLVRQLVWSPDHRSVLATVEAHDARGARYTLGYELDVVDVDGRWEVSAIEMESDQ